MNKQICRKAKQLLQRCWTNKGRSKYVNAESLITNLLLVDSVPGIVENNLYFITHLISDNHRKQIHLSSLYGWWNEGTVRLSNLPMVTQIRLSCLNNNMKEDWLSCSSKWHRVLLFLLPSQEVKVRKAEDIWPFCQRRQSVAWQGYDASQVPKSICIHSESHPCSNPRRQVWVISPLQSSCS